MAVEADLARSLLRLEAARQESLSRMRIWIGAVMASAGAVALYFYLASSPAGTLVTLAIGLIVASGVSIHLLRKVKRAFKEEIMPALLEEIDPSLQYEAGGCVSQEDFRHCGLFMRPDRYRGKDLIEGRIGQTAVRFSLIHAEEEYEETSTDADGNRRSETQYRTIFRGLFFVADFNKHFSGRTLVRPKAVTFMSRLFGSHVALEDPQFNELFTVNSTDQIEARYIMTASLMEKFKVLRSKAGAFRASFFLGQLILALEMPWNAFEPSMRRSLADSDQVRKIQGNLRLITGIVEDLGLNVRIWTKAGTDPASQ